ncbi:MAG: hypothetical protein HUU01_08900 [Saprospiraceae bacterium]|nr:hypothetical protein [Saprospiraceae bacterium]
MEIILLINGILFAYLLFSKKLTDKDKARNKRSAYLGLGVFLAFFMVLILFHYLGMHQMVEIITWIGIFISSAAIGIRLFQVFRKKG